MRPLRGVVRRTRDPDRDFWDILFGEGAPLGRRRTLLLLLIVSAGLLTFFVPLITTSPAVLGKERWSIFDVAWHVGQKELPPSNWSIHVVRLPLDPAFVYLLLLGVLSALLFLPRLHKRLAWMALLGIFLTLEMGQFDDVDFERTFYEQASYRSNFALVHHVDFGQLVLTLLGVYGAILFVVMREDLDTEVNENSCRRSGRRATPKSQSSLMSKS